MASGITADGSRQKSSSALHCLEGNGVRLRSSFAQESGINVTPGTSQSNGYSYL